MNAWLYVDEVLALRSTVSRRDRLRRHARKTYPGPELPPNEIAAIQETTGATVLEIDVERVSGYTLALLPGTHDLLLRVRIYTNAPTAK